MAQKMVSNSKDKDGILLVNEVRSLGIGGMSRYKLTVNKKKFLEQNITTDELFVRIKNTENALLRPVYITGPYSFYVDIRPINYNEDKPFKGNEILQFVENLKPDERFKAKLLFNENSKVGESDDYCWIIDIVSQLAVITYPKLGYNIRIGTDKPITKGRGKGKDVTAVEGISLKEWDQHSLWNLPPKYPKKPIHLVIITHGIFSNVGCDMLYMKDKIEEAAFAVPENINQNIVVRGCMDNMGKSARGVHYLGKRVGQYVIKTIDELNKKYKVDKISFIGHSLGGPTQSMAVHYMAIKRPDLFDLKNGIKPMNFITLAAPFIGVIGDFPLYLSLPLDMGALGLTGRDLNLKYTPLTSKDGLYLDGNNSKNEPKLILEILPHDPVKVIFERFVNRTAYANIVHDGIVPLRTAALLYLDWKGLKKVSKVKKHEEQSPVPELNAKMNIESSNDDLNSEDKGGHVAPTGEIPSDDLEKKATAQWFLPQALIHTGKDKKFRRGQTMDASSESDEDSVNGKQPPDAFRAPPEASTILSALSVLTAPLPSQDYIKNPELRSDSIVHDKLYRPEELPAPHYIGRSSIKKVMYPNESINRIQERIARSWQETMTWRKVLVRIQPDSHNNIVVRRRFVNLFGNVAVSHMVHTHFGEEACRRYASKDF